MKKTFGDVLCDNLTDEELKTLWKLKRPHKADSYKIIITSDRYAYDNLSELAEHPELGHRVGTFYFHTPSQLDLIYKAFEGLFYQLFSFSSTELVTISKRMTYGVVDDLIYESWLDEECSGVCGCCFLRNEVVNGEWTCRKEE